MPRATARKSSPVGIRSHTGVDAGAYQSRVAPGRAAPSAPRGRRRMLDVAQSPRFCSHRSPDRAYLRQARARSRGSPHRFLLPGVERVLDRVEQREIGLDHPRSGELVALARTDAWFTYYYWVDDQPRAGFRTPRRDPSQAGIRSSRTFLSIQRSALPNLQSAGGSSFALSDSRTLMDVIPLDASLVRGSHGRLTEDPHDGPLNISSEPGLVAESPIAAVDVKPTILAHVFEEPSSVPA